MTVAATNAEKMDAIYRYQRHIYDLTRSHYLLGRDDLIADLQPPRDASVLEVGCGTGRNLLALLDQYPHVQAYGFDVSALMLAAARSAIAKRQQTQRIALFQVDACGADALPQIGARPYDRIYFSYVLSMLPDWRQAVANAIAALAPDGEIHIVDFGQGQDLPALFQKLLLRWLRHFHVTPITNFDHDLRQVCGERNCQSRSWQTHRSYTLRCVIRRNAGSNAYQSSFGSLS